jgi:hypothetical protein
MEFLGQGGGYYILKKKSSRSSSAVINGTDSCIAVRMCRVAVISLMECKKVVMKCIVLCVKNGLSDDFNSVVVLQTCMGLIKDEPDSGSEACVATLDDGTEEGSIKLEEVDMKVEEILHIEEENSEGPSFATMKSEIEVSVWACVGAAMVPVLCAWGCNDLCFVSLSAWQQCFVFCGLVCGTAMVHVFWTYYCYKKRTSAIPFNCLSVPCIVCSLLFRPTIYFDN